MAFVVVVFGFLSIAESNLYNDSNQADVILLF